MKLKKMSNKRNLLDFLNLSLTLNKNYHGSYYEMRNLRNSRLHFDKEIKIFYICKKDGSQHSEKPLGYSKNTYRIVVDSKKKKKIVLRAINQELSKIETPSYLFSKKKHNYYQNSMSHLGNKFILTMDLENFFDNCTYKQVLAFFLKRGNCGLHMSEDIAAIMANIVTYKNCKSKHRSLAQGYPTSSLLSFFSYKEMFDKINDISRTNNIVFSLYVDDLTFTSNNKINDVFIEEIKDIIESYNLKVNNTKTKLGESGVITGMYLKRNKLRAGNKIHRNFNAYYKRCKSMKINNKDDYFKFWISFNSLNGLFYTLNQVEPLEKYRNERKNQKIFIEKNKKYFSNHISPNDSYFKGIYSGYNKEIVYSNFLRGDIKNLNKSDFKVN